MYLREKIEKSIGNIKAEIKTLSDLLRELEDILK